MKNFFYTSTLLFLLLAVALPAHRVQAQHEGFLYGEVTLANNERYEGQIYWSAGQRMWVDLLNVEKKDNPVLKYLNNGDLEKLSQEEEQKQVNWGFMDLWKNKYPARKHPLRCRFGDIATIQVTGEKEAQISFKNGETLQVYINEDREYRRQLGERITIQDAQKGKITVEWGQLRQVRFSQTPNTLAHLNTLPLYGTVATRTGNSFTGQIKWDLDEFMTANWVDGKGRDGQSARFRFTDVQAIRPQDDGALVKLQSGEEVFLRDNSNVNGKNQGIVVRHPEWGQVVVRWQDFKTASFSPYPEQAGFGYGAFPKARTLRGRVWTTDNQTWKGALVYDLDERLDVETLEGYDVAGAFHQIPFRHVRQVSPKTNRFATVSLRDGKTLVLGERSDVTEQNWGLLVWPQPENYQYIPWDKISRLLLD